jgi:hypothetical protein
MVLAVQRTRGDGEGQRPGAGGGEGREVQGLEGRLTGGRGRGRGGGGLDGGGGGQHCGRRKGGWPRLGWRVLGVLSKSSRRLQLRRPRLCVCCVCVSCLMAKNGERGGIYRTAREGEGRQFATSDLCHCFSVFFYLYYIFITRAGFIVLRVFSFSLDTRLASIPTLACIHATIFVKSNHNEIPQEN